MPWNFPFDDNNGPFYISDIFVYLGAIPFRKISRWSSVQRFLYEMVD
jgi:hypothetical protein